MGNVLDEPMPQVEYPAWMAAEERQVTLQVSGNDLLWRIEQSWVEVSLQAKGGVENRAGMVERGLPVYADHIAHIRRYHSEAGADALGKEDGWHALLAHCRQDAPDGWEEQLAVELVGHCSCKRLEELENLNTVSHLFQGIGNAHHSFLYIVSEELVDQVSSVSFGGHQWMLILALAVKDIMAQISHLIIICTYYPFTTRAINCLTFKRVR